MGQAMIARVNTRARKARIELPVMQNQNKKMRRQQYILMLLDFYGFAVVGGFQTKGTFSTITWAPEVVSDSREPFDHTKPAAATINPVVSVIGYIYTGSMG